jgi:thiamine biosynthesis lipoprotein
MAERISRRRFIGITVAEAGLALLPLGRPVKATAAVVSWHGTALGATTTLQIHHADRAAAEALIQQAMVEVHRLERLFSLYRSDSMLVELNRRGVLEAPAKEMVELLDEARRTSGLTGGAFDPTVQPLWALYAEHFSQPSAAADGPPATAVGAALEKVGLDKLVISRDRIAFAHQGMALTLNGIAQGYITDRIVELLRGRGIEHSLVDMGESRALGRHPDGRPWSIGLADPDHPDRVTRTIPLIDQAVATSGQHGFRFDGDGRFNHLLDPKTGQSAIGYRSVTVVTATATADALSTAFSLLRVEAITAALAQIGHGRAYLTTAGGREIVLGS